MPVFLDFTTSAGDCSLTTLRCIAVEHRRACFWILWVSNLARMTGCTECHLQRLLNQLGGLVVAVHERPLVRIDLAVHNRAAQVILEPCQHVVLARRTARRARHGHAVIGAACSGNTHLRVSPVAAKGCAFGRYCPGGRGNGNGFSAHRQSIYTLVLTSAMEL